MVPFSVCWYDWARISASSHSTTSPTALIKMIITIILIHFGCGFSFWLLLPSYETVLWPRTDPQKPTLLSYRNTAIWHVVEINACRHLGLQNSEALTGSAEDKRHLWVSTLQSFRFLKLSCWSTVLIGHRCHTSCILLSCRYSGAAACLTAVHVMPTWYAASADRRFNATQQERTNIKI